MRTQDYLEYVHRLASYGADTDKPFWYLSGPMSGYPQYNFPAFAQAAETLRGFGYNLVSPAELDDPEVYAAVINDPQGTSLDSDDHARLLARDLVIVSLPNCVGCMVLPGWQVSVGALAETYVADVLGKQIVAFYEDIADGPVLIPLERSEYVSL